MTSRWTRAVWVILGLSALTPSSAGCARTLSIGDDDRPCGPDGGHAGDAGGSSALEFDLARDAVDRTLIEPVTNRQLDTVTLGEVTGDGVMEVLVADASDVTLGGDYRPGAGTVYGFRGGTAFFTGASSDVREGTVFRILGATAGDRLGTGAASGDVATGDVTGDGIDDVVVGATFASGMDDARLEAGEVYVLTGGPGLAGDIDLSTTTPRARIVGASAGDRLALLAVGDVTGDGISDVIVGSPMIDTENGVDSGAAYVVVGGSSLTGVVDLALPGPETFRIVGPAANAGIGTTAAVGDILGSSAGDLLIGAPTYSDALRARGAAYARRGPIDSDLDLSMPAGSAGGPSIVWIGAGQNDGLGVSVALGNVLGDAARDVVIGGYQQRCGGPQLGAVRVWDGASLEEGATYALAFEDSATAVFYGADANDGAGTALALGDMNGDGYLDLPVASGLADGPSEERTDAGELAVFLGGPSLMGILDLGVYRGVMRVYGAGPTDGLGLHVAGIALDDVDGDGRADLCVGSFQGGESDGGRIDCMRSPF